MMLYLLLYFCLPLTRTSQISEILSLRSDSCIIALLELTENSTLGTFFDAFLSEFDNPVVSESIAFRKYEAPFEWSDGTSLLAHCNTDGNNDDIKYKFGKNCHSEIVAFKKHPPDITCLFPPPVPDKVAFEAVYKGHLNFEDFASFVNVNCETYFTSDGGLNELGVMKNRLEKELPWKYDVRFEDIINSKAEYPRCPEIADPTTIQFLKDYISKSRPVIIKNAAQDWPALQKWNLNFLKSSIPKDRKVHIKVAPFGEFEGVENITLWKDFTGFNFPSFVKDQLKFPDLVVVRPATLDMTFREFVESLASRDYAKANASLYLEYSSIQDYLEETTSDFSEFEFIADWLRLDSTNIWLSDGNTLGKLHFDPLDNILVMVEGEKELTLFDPFNNGDLYEAHIQEAKLKFSIETKSFLREGLQQSTSIVMSPLDILKPNLKMFPNAAESRPVRCRISKGDALFLPAFWWHEVQSFPSDNQFNLAINFWYDPFYNKEFPCPDCQLNVNFKYRQLMKKLK